MSATGGDITQVQADFVALMIRLNASTTSIEQYVSQIKKLSGAIMTSDNASISLEIELFIESQIKLFKSQLGLENFDIDPEIQNDPEFSEFLAMYAQFLSETREIKTKGGFSFEYFTTKVNKRYAKFLRKMIKASKKAVEKKSIPSK